MDECMDGQMNGLVDRWTGDSTHVWRGVDAVGVDDHRRGVGLQDKGQCPL